MDYAAFMGVVAGLAVILAEQLFSRTVGGGCDSRLARAPLDLCCMEMIKRDIQSPPDCSAALCTLTASITMPLISGMEKMRSAREKRAESGIPR